MVTGEDWSFWRKGGLQPRLSYKWDREEEEHCLTESKKMGNSSTALASAPRPRIVVCLCPTAAAVSALAFIDEKRGNILNPFPQKVSQAISFNLQNVF